MEKSKEEVKRGASPRHAQHPKNTLLKISSRKKEVGSHREEAKKSSGRDDRGKGCNNLEEVHARIGVIEGDVTSIPYI
jgi:hypothetical protein